MSELAQRIQRAWEGRISGCQLGKPVELMSMREGYDALHAYLTAGDELPLRDYIGYQEGARVDKACCRDYLTRSEPDDDINYSVLSLLMLEQHGRALSTVDVARFWLRLLPAGQTYTAERAAYRVLLSNAAEWFAEGADPGFDLAECAANPYNTWIGAQIRTDLYGWVCPGDPEQAASLARQDAALSHVDDGVYGAVIVAALGAALADSAPEVALEKALAQIPAHSGCAAAVQLAMQLRGDADGPAQIRAHYGDLSPVATVNNLALVIWSLYSHLDDFGAAIGNVVSAGLDTDCNGATVGGLWGLQGDAIPAAWTAPWQGRVGLGLAGFDEVALDDLVARTVAIAATG
ncbi:MAG: ADP-ribosylglycohydrolase family protein [Pseudomonadota bacterium]